MIAIPAIDLREGACVQLVGGSYADERIRIADPLDAARRWTAAGFQRIHVVDLDAATEAGSNADAIERLIIESGADIQVGGGIRSTERVREILALGASRVVVGTRAIEDLSWLHEVATQHPERLIVAADVRGPFVVTHGWKCESTIDVRDFIVSLAELPVAGCLVTAVHREGLMSGTEVDLMKELVSITRVPIVASGGIATLEELRSLSIAGIAGAVLGMSLYTGVLDPRAVAREFAQ